MFRLDNNQKDDNCAAKSRSEFTSELTPEEQQKRLDYWRNNLHDLSTLNLMRQDPDKIKDSATKKYLQFALDPALFIRVTSLAIKNQCEPKHYFLSALYFTLLQYGQEADITIGTSTEKKQASTTNNVLPLRIKNASDYSFDQLARAFSSCEIEAIKHFLPINDIFTILDFDKRAIFKKAVPCQVFLDIDNTNMERADDDACPFEYFGINITQKKCLLEYSPQRFNDTFLKQFLVHFNKILAHATRFPDAKLNSFPTLLEKEKNAIKIYNTTEIQLNTSDTLLEHMQMIAQNQPTLPFAIMHDDSYKKTSLHYQQLNKEANSLAHYLKTLELPPNSYIGFILDRSFRLFSTFFAALKLGLPFIPLDTAQGASLSYKLTDPNLACIITDNTYMHLLQNTTHRVINLDNQKVQKQIQEQTTTNLNDIITRPTDPAYKIYTSGSTGTPKGVVIPRAGLDNLHVGLSHINIPDKAHIICTASARFDAFYFDVILAIAKMGTVHLTSEARRQDNRVLDRILLTNKQINVGVFVPDQLRLLNPDCSLMHIITMGAPPNEAILKKWRKTGRTISNGYGPTENSIATSLCLYKANQDVNCIGSGLANIQLFCVEPTTKKLSLIDTEGEIWIAGPGLALEYAGLLEATQEKFQTYYLNEKTAAFETVPSHTNAKPIRIYKTGDYGCFQLQDGKINIKFLGRKDRQIKLNGARIELEGLQQVIKKHELIDDAVVKLNQRGNHLIYFITFNAAAIPENNFRKSIIMHLKGSAFPMATYPKTVVRLNHMPLNNNNKIDWPRLADIEKALEDRPTSSETSHTVTYTEAEKKLLPLILKTLNITESDFNNAPASEFHIELHNQEHTLMTSSHTIDFASLGGDSLNLIRLQNMIIDQRETLGIKPQLSEKEIRNAIQPESTLSELVQVLFEKTPLKTAVNETTVTTGLETYSMFANSTERQNNDKEKTNTHSIEPLTNISQ